MFELVYIENDRLVSQRITLNDFITKVLPEVKRSEFVRWYSFASIGDTFVVSDHILAVYIGEPE